MDIRALIMSTLGSALILGACMTPTPVPIATWVAQGVPEDTVIRYGFSEPLEALSVDVVITANGVFTVTEQFGGRGSSDITQSTGQFQQDELREILLKFAEIDFFSITSYREATGRTCHFYTADSLPPQTEEPLWTDVGPRTISLTIRGMHKTIFNEEGCPSALRAEQALDSLDEMIYEAIMTQAPTHVPVVPTLTSGG
jgi:hypothetical protein